MFSSLVSWRTKRANNRLVASSIMAIRYSFSPRPSSQSCPLVSPDTCCSCGVSRAPPPHPALALPTRPPNVHLLHLLRLGSPQFPLDHPLPYRLFARLDSVFLSQILRPHRAIV